MSSFMTENNFSLLFNQLVPYITQPHWFPPRSTLSPKSAQKGKIDTQQVKYFPPPKRPFLLPFNLISAFAM